MKKRGKGRSRELEEVGEERRLPDSDRSRRRLFSFARDRWRLASLLIPLEHRPRPTKVLPSHRRDEEQSSSVHRARESGARTAVPRPRSVSFFLSRAAAPSSSATAEKRRCRAQKKKKEPPFLAPIFPFFRLDADAGVRERPQSTRQR